jgi:type IV pilus assembly protein PilA
MKRLQQLKSNKGFSLVELLIVIAIMAVLVGVLAPQYFRYVERSRQSADVQALNSITNAIQTTTLDPMYEEDIPMPGTIVVTWTTETGALGVTITGTGDADTILRSITNVVGTTVDHRSNLVGQCTTIVMTYTLDAEGIGTMAIVTNGLPSARRDDFNRMFRNVGTITHSGT